MDRRGSPVNLKVDVDRCVKCGLCLPDCPTYRLSGSENESPRGRVALIEGVLQGGLDPADDAVRRHLDSCLLCRSCERGCPSGVPYGRILDEARAAWLPRARPAWYTRLVEHPTALRAATLGAKMVPRWVTRPAAPFYRLHLLARALHAESPPAPGHYPAERSPARGRVGLFLGCATRAQQGSALQAAVFLLNRLGFDVIVPSRATCCGALAAHRGDREHAERLAEQNRNAYGEGLDAVISVASGCGIHLDACTPGLRAPHRDVCRFLIESGGLSSDHLAPRAQRAALHTPCSVANVYRGGPWAFDLLTMVPGLSVTRIGGDGGCCGAAGDYLMRHPATAERLRQPLLDQALDDGADVVLTSNVGCAMHLAAGLLERRSQMEVLHPVELLARQLILARGDVTPDGTDFGESGTI